MRKGIGGHHRAYRGRSDEWLTPPEIIKALGPFDLDPCAPKKRPWPTAKLHYTEEDDGLSKPWEGRVWCNPPYGPETTGWLKSMCIHGCGTALIFAHRDRNVLQVGVGRGHGCAVHQGPIALLQHQGRTSQS